MKSPLTISEMRTGVGEQTEEVLAEFGFGAEEVAKLRQAKVV